MDTVYVLCWATNLTALQSVHQHCSVLKPMSSKKPSGIEDLMRGMMNHLMLLRVVSSTLKVVPTRICDPKRPGLVLLPE